MQSSKIHIKKNKKKKNKHIKFKNVIGILKNSNFINYFKI